MNTVYYNYSYDFDNSDALAAVGLGALGTMLIVYILVILVIAILQIVAMWKIFTKAGEKGWKSIIPVYNLVILFKVSGLSPWLVLLYLLGVIPFVGWIACLILNIVQANGLAKSFGKDIGYTIGLIFLAPIFYLILGLGKSEYVGSKTEV